jgi:Ca2+-transporting ATPase
VQIALQAAVISAAVLGAMGFALAVLGFDKGQAVTVSFLTLALAQLWHVFNMRDQDTALFDNEITRNPWIWAAVVLCLALLAAALLIPPLKEVLRLVDPGRDGLALALAASLLPLLLGPPARWLARKLN